jgi:hypothetical protein
MEGLVAAVEGAGCPECGGTVFHVGHALMGIIGVDAPEPHTRKGLMLGDTLVG